MQKLVLEQKVVLITGVAGFIGANLALALLRSFDGIRIIGIDNMNDYYDVSLKEYRIARIWKTANFAGNVGNLVLGESPSEKSATSLDAISEQFLKDRECEKGSDREPAGISRLNSGRDFGADFDITSDRFQFIKADISDKSVVRSIFQTYQPDIVVNLAAQAGVRYSITNPDAYIASNMVGFYNILEACRHSYDNAIESEQTEKTEEGGGNRRAGQSRQSDSSAKGVEHLIYASSSSVYGANAKIPYSTDDRVDNPVSLYAATKKSNELMAHAYAKLYNIPSTGLRFFTVYGPAGRPDMAYFGFTDKLRAGEKIRIFNYGNCKRDFTYIDDIVEGIIRVMQKAPEKQVGEDGLPLPPYAVYNIGNNHPENLLDFVDILQQELVRAGVLSADYDFEAHKELVPMQPGDVPVTYADTSALWRDFGFRPSTDLRTGLRAFAEWYKGYYGC